MIKLSSKLCKYLGATIDEKLQVDKTFIVLLDKSVIESILSFRISLKGEVMKIVRIIKIYISENTQPMTLIWMNCTIN